MIRPELVERTQRFLFASEEEMDEAHVTRLQRERLLRLRAMYTFWINKPMLAEKAIVDEIQKRYHVCTSLAYEDVRLIKICLGNLNQNTQDYYRYLFLARAEEAFQMARANNDPRAFAAALATLGKYTRLDQEDRTAPEYSQIVPQTFEITSDPTAAGFKRIPNVEDVAQKMLARYRKEAAQAMEVEVVEVKPIGSQYEAPKEEEHD